MPAEELVERVLARDVHRQPAAAPAGAAPLLAQRGDGAGERHATAASSAPMSMPSSSASVVTTASSSPSVEPALQLAPLGRGVAGAVGGDAVGQLGGTLPEVLLDVAGDQLHGAAGLDEADRPRALLDELGDHVGGLGQDGAPRAQRLVEERGVPDRDAAGALRATPSSIHEREVVEAGEALGQLDGIGDRRRGEQEARLRPVGRGDPAQAAQHVADMGAEHPAVDVRLVDHDGGEIGEQLAPRPWLGRIPTWSMSGFVRTGLRACGSPRARSRGVSPS